MTDIKENNNIIYYHYFCTERSAKIFDSTLNKIVDSELYCHTNTLFVNVIGIDCNRHLSELQIKYKDKKKILFKSHRSDKLKKIRDSYTKDQISKNPRLIKGSNGMEGDTLELLHTNTINSTENANILYIHSKGATNQDGFCKWNSREEWRNHLENGTINNWRECLNNLADKPHVGPNYFGNYQANGIPHYSGNFWWTTSEHIKKLVPFDVFCNEGFLINKILNKINKNPDHKHFLNALSSPFYLAEYWITHGSSEF